tara:strand:- start:14065 stop:14427 length:363 start_codon:yes stop_codon:yes gene_type:complete
VWEQYLKIEMDMKKMGCEIQSMSYTESATDGNWVGMLRFAILNGALWAIGSSWSTAIRAVTLQIVPTDSRDVVFGEIIAAMATTFASVVVSYAVMRCCRRHEKEETPIPTPFIPQRPSRI